MIDTLSVAAIVVGSVLHVLIWRRWGRQVHVAQGVGRYWYEVPVERPATVAATLRRGNRFAGTIIDLAQRGYLTIQDISTAKQRKKIFGRRRDWQFTQNKQADESLLPFESRLLQYLFEGGREVKQSELHKRAQKDSFAATNLTRAFKMEVDRTVDGIFWEDHRATTYVLNLGVAAVAAAVGIFCLINGSEIGVATLVAGLVIALLSLNLKRRTELGVQKTAEWKALRSYLREFGNFKDAPAGHLILWERYLVYAVALGVAKQLAAGLAHQHPEVASADSGFASWYVPADGDFDFSHIAEIADFGDGVSGDIFPDGGGDGGSGDGGGDGGGGGD